MKNKLYQGLALAALLLAGGATMVRAQEFSVPWFVVAAGGGTASGGNFSVTGTFGQWNVAAQPSSGGAFDLTSGFWSFLVTNQIIQSTTLFSDDFAGNTIDSSKWMVSGDTVIQSNGVMSVLNNTIDDGGVLTSAPIALKSLAPITITRQAFLHPQPSSQTNYPGVYFFGQFGITIGVLPQFSVYYADMDYGDGVAYMPRHGFFLARDGQSPLLIADQTNISAAISPVWDTWFNETITYDPASGVMDYFINGASLMTFNVGVLPPTPFPTMTLTFNAAGWWTGHQQLFENLNVSQADDTNANRNITVSGNLAFGGVAVGTAANSILSISNGGNATLTITSIHYPAGFTGPFAGTIAAGSATNISVAFSPTSATNYGGTLQVLSDATSGSGARAISGFGASGTLVLVVDINGTGTVSPNLNGKTLIAGKKYTLRAVPKGDEVFVNWTGSTNTTQNPLNFIMEPSTVLQANFATSPFVTVKGTYNGLFANSNGVTEETAGFLKNLAVSTKGSYTGTLFINGAAHPVHGAFDLTGQTTNHVTRPAKQGGPLTATLSLTLASTPPQVTGTVVGTNNGIAFTSDLVADRGASNGTAQFTMVLAPTEFGQPGVPSGYGYDLMAEHKGTLTLSGALPDGTVINQTVPVSESGEVPVFSSLYANTGLLMGWVDMTDGTPTGNLTWIKKTARAGLYQKGFTNEVVAEGAGWTNRTPAAAITLPAGQLSLTGGALATPLTFNVALSSKNVLTKTGSTPTNSLTGSVNPKTGLLTITFGNGTGKATTVAKGAVLQDTTNAAGYFLSKTNAGSLILVP